MRVLVIGAGLGGLTLAQGLTKQGVEVATFERDPAAESRAQGARFHLDERGVRALRECLRPASFALFEATLGEPSESIHLLDDRLSVVLTKPFTGPDGIRPGRPASRQLVRRILADGMDVRYGMALTSFEQNESGVSAHFADGTTEHGDVLVAADGIGSAVRRQYLPHAKIVDTGFRWLGGKTPLTEELLATGLPDRIGGSFTATMVGENRMIVAAVRFTEPPSRAAARLLPGFDPGETADYLMWAVLARDMDFGPDLWPAAKSLTRQAHPTLRLVVDGAWQSQLYALTMGTSEPVPPWPTTRVTLLGDAIHAMPPNRGSGANTALQDARRLSKALATGTPLLPSIAAYEEALRRDGFEAVRASTEALATM